MRKKYVKPELVGPLRSSTEVRDYLRGIGRKGGLISRRTGRCKCGAYLRKDGVCARCTKKQGKGDLS